MAHVVIKKTDKVNGQILAKATQSNKESLTKNGSLRFFKETSSLLKKDESNESKVEKIIKTKLKDLDPEKTTPDIAALIYAIIKIACDEQDKGVILHRTHSHILKDLKQIMNKIKDPSVKTVLHKLYNIINTIDPKQMETAMKKVIDTLKNGKAYKVEKIHSNKNSKTKPSAPKAPEAPKNILAGKKEPEQGKSNFKKTSTSRSKTDHSDLLNEIRKGKTLKDAKERKLADKPINKKSENWDHTEALQNLKKKIPVFDEKDANNKGPTEDNEWGN